ncbi:MAG: hypothetical protein ACHQX3_00355, partial [Nitrospirales bacterium]
AVTDSRNEYLPEGDQFLALTLLVQLNERQINNIACTNSLSDYRSPRLTEAERVLFQEMSDWKKA